jgi:hypothetical protein
LWWCGSSSCPDARDVMGSSARDDVVHPNSVVMRADVGIVVHVHGCSMRHHVNPCLFRSCDRDPNGWVTAALRVLIAVWAMASGGVSCLGADAAVAIAQGPLRIFRGPVVLPMEYSPLNI